MNTFNLIQVWPRENVFWELARVMEEEEEDEGEKGCSLRPGFSHLEEKEGRKPHFDNEFQV